MILTSYSRTETADDFIGRPMVEVQKKKKTKKGFKKIIIGHFRRIFLLVVNVFLNHDWFFSAIGWANRRWGFLTSVFVAYPATEEYALAYVYPRHRHIMRWLPWPAGIFKQNGKWGLMTVISATEKDFIDPINKENLKFLAERTEKIRQLVGASQKTFAGILPGVLYAKRIIKETVEADTTVDAVLKAETELRKAESYPSDVPIIVLGGKGFIGSRMMKKLRWFNREAYSVEAKSDWPTHLEGKKAILLNLTKKAVLSLYLDLWWQELLLLNEVYPDPTPSEIDSLTKLGARAYHVVGVVSKSYPSFPKAYWGGIPCCAARNCEQMEVIIRKLN